MIPFPESSIDVRRKKLCIASNENKGGFVKMLDDEENTTTVDDEDFTWEEISWALESSL